MIPRKQSSMAMITSREIDIVEYTISKVSTFLLVSHVHTKFVAHRFTYTKFYICCNGLNLMDRALDMDETDAKSTNGTIASIPEENEDEESQNNANNTNIEMETRSIASLPRSLARSVSNASTMVRRKKADDPNDPKTAITTCLLYTSDAADE